MENKTEIKKNSKDSSEKTLLVVDTEKIESAITNAVKPLVELWIEKSNETEQLRITHNTELENKKLEFQTKQLSNNKRQFNLFVVVFIITVILAITLEIMGRFTITTGIIVTAVLTLSGSFIASFKSKSHE